MATNEKFTSHSSSENGLFTAFITEKLCVTIDQNIADNIKASFNNTANGFINADNALVSTFESVVEIALDKKLVRKDAGILLALILGVSSMNKACGEGEAFTKDNKRIKSKWDGVNRTRIPTAEHLTNNPHASYEQVAEALGSAKFAKKYDIKVTGTNKPSKEPSEPTSQASQAIELVSDLIKDKQYNKVIETITANLSQDDKVLFANALLKGLDMSADESEKVADAIYPRQVRAQVEANLNKAPRGTATPPRQKAN